MRGCRADLFVCGYTPYPSLRDIRLLDQQPSRTVEVLTPSILFRPSRERRPPQSGQRRRNPPVYWAVQAGLAPRGLLLPRKKGRCNRPPFVLLSSCYNWLAWRNGVGLCWRATRQGIAKSRARQGRAAASVVELRQPFCCPPLERPCFASKNAFRSAGIPPNSLPPPSWIPPFDR